MNIIVLPEKQNKIASDKDGLLFQSLAWVLTRVLPKANLDYDAQMPFVTYWLIEIDEEFRAVREIGFNNRNEPIVFAPTDRNYGLWTDSDRIFTPGEFEERNGFPFDKIWNQLANNTY